MNVYQAALKLRTDYQHEDISTEALEDKVVNTYFIFHDALHTYLNAPPREEYEGLVLATELVLGGQDWQHIDRLKDVDIDQITNVLGLLDEEVLLVLVDFYSNYYNV